MKKNKTIIIYMLFVLNIILLIKVYMNNIQNQKLLIDKNNLYLLFHENFNENSLLNPALHKYKSIRFIDTNSIQGGKYKLIAIFDKNNCIECMINEIKYLNDFTSKYKKLLKVYFISNEEDFLKTLGAKFNYNLISNTNNLFSEHISFASPLVFLISPSNSVFEIHKVETGVKIKSEIFYRKINELFESLFP